MGITSLAGAEIASLFVYLANIQTNKGFSPTLGKALRIIYIMLNWI